MKRNDVKIETVIKAKPDKVWQIISDFGNWGNWHKASDMKDVQLLTINKSPRILKFNIYNLPLKILLSRVEIAEGESISWRGFIPFSQALLSGERKIMVVPDSGTSCTLVQTEAFHGVLSRFFKKRLSAKYNKNYKILNQNIKRIAES